MAISLSELRSLSVAEKLKIVNALWQDIAECDTPPKLPPSVMDEVRRRGDELVADPTIALTRDEMWQRVEQRDG